MSPDPRRELRRLQDSPVFKTYTELRRMSMCYGMMDAKLAELQDAVRRVRCSGPARWSSYDVIESETMEVCQLLADFLSRMYSCKNLASVMAKRHGVDREFRALKHDGLGFEASVVVNLRNYVVHVDMMPLEVDPGTGAVVFTRRCGSDQMWSLHPTGYKIEPVYFGEFKIPAASNIQGYAISSNIQSLHTIGKERLSKYARNFKRLSFREKAICDEVEKLTGRRGKVVLDPSLLLDFNDWDKLTTHNIVKKKYILTYFLHEESSDPEFKKKVQQFAQRQGLELVDMFDIAFSPVNFLNAIKHAECILAASFHAVAFSILFQKTFYALKTNDGKDIRYINLMDALGIDRLIESNTLPTLCPTAIDYEKVNNKLKELRIDSLEYLKTL